MMHGRIHVSDQNAYAGLFLGEIIHTWIPVGAGILVGLKLLPYWIGFLRMIISLF